MSPHTLRARFLAALFALLALSGMTLALNTAHASATAINADQVRAQWEGARKAYLEAIAPYNGQAQHAALLQEYTAALDETGKSLEAYIKAKQSNPAGLTPAVDQLTKNLTQLKTLQAKAKGNLITVLGGALKQQQQVTQNAIKNMR
jgi:hypothetical protein